MSNYTKAPSLRSVAADPWSIDFPLETFKDKGYLTHNFHPYPAKFVPQIPRIVIEALSSPADVVLDPFCGSGTTLVEAALLGRHAVGLDLHPLAAMVSTAKTTPLSTTETVEVRRVLQRVLSLAAGAAPSGLARIPDFKNRDHWFQAHVQHELAEIKYLIQEHSTGAARTFLLTALSAIVVKVSNQDSDTRWVAVPKTVAPGATYTAFAAKVAQMRDRLVQYEQRAHGSVRVEVQSATQRFPLTGGTAGLVVTSPPYLNSYDYYLYHKLRLFWLGIDHYSVQAAELGSRHRHCDLGQGIESYVDGITMAFREMQRVVADGRYIVVVIGDSILRGQLIEMDALYSRIGTSAGLSVERVFSYDQRKYTTAFTQNLKRTPKKTHILFFRR